MTSVRHAAVAGLFYPGEADGLRAAVTGYLREAAVDAGADAKGQGQAPKALIVPHAGYIYSGPVAASAYVHLSGAAERISRVVLLGPAHRLPFDGLALPGAGGFETPLGVVPIDQDAIDRIAPLPQVHDLPQAHAGEHSLEVHLPFLQTLLKSFSLLPLVVGSATAAEVAEVLDLLWGGEETLIVISTDLSHYHDYDTAHAKDAATSAAIEALDEGRIGFDDACGRIPVSGLLYAARAHGITPRLVDLRNSGDTAGARDSVVGYGAYVLG
ncbi:MAG: AmmeMemoRadiSam system protein B [Alphaproteobacteria bacterium]|nr:AmmeMemoRadiSam system protein B [Alphaproteobacteria bacterium]MDP6831285.1 AmmeMemoRadiSam system protein B [Alphaproteobacteria bacterium]